MPRKFFTSVLSISALALLLACSDDDKTGGDPGTKGGDPLASATPVVEQYAKNVHANYAECLTTAQALKTAIDAFVAAPSEDTLKAAKDAWVAARKPYG